MVSPCGTTKFTQSGGLSLIPRSGDPPPPTPSPPPCPVCRIGVPRRPLGNCRRAVRARGLWDGMEARGTYWLSSRPAALSHSASPQPRKVGAVGGVKCHWPESRGFKFAAPTGEKRPAPRAFSPATSGKTNELSLEDFLELGRIARSATKIIAP